MGSRSPAYETNCAGLYLQFLEIIRMVTKFVIKAIKVITIIFMPCFMSGCILLMLTGPTQLDPAQTKPLALKQFKAQVYTMRGFLDVFSTGMNSLAKTIQTQLNIQATALSYLEEKKLAHFLIQNQS